MYKKMKRILIALAIAAFTIVLLAACGDINQNADVDEQASLDEEITEKVDSENEEWVTSDFIPGAEKFFLRRQHL